MSGQSRIEWTSATWNPVTGCTKVSAGCDRCYAETFAERWRGVPGHHFENGFDVTLRPGRLEQPLKWKRPRLIFINSMSDLFHKDVPGDFIVQVFATMARTPQHTYQLLTKRQGRMRNLLQAPNFEEDVRAAVWQMDGHSARRVQWPLPNLWLGVSVEDPYWEHRRIPFLLDTPAAVRFVSAEPLLGPVYLRPGEWLPPLGGGPKANLFVDAWGVPSPDPLPSLDWIIVGGESGAGARPMVLGWARNIVRQCQETGTPVFMKQLGSALGRERGAGSKGGDWDAWPEDLRVREFPRTPAEVTA